MECCKNKWINLCKTEQCIYKVSTICRNIKIHWRKSNVSHSRKQNEVTLSLRLLPCYHEADIPGILTPERTVCEGAALSRIKQAESSQPLHPSQTCPRGKAGCALNHPLFCFLAILPPWISRAPCCFVNHRMPFQQIPLLLKLIKDGFYYLQPTTNMLYVCPSDTVIQWPSL